MASDSRLRTLKSLQASSKELDSLLGMLNSVHGISLPLCNRFEDFGQFKEFCSGLLERRHHRFDGVLSGCSALVRSSVASSLFLFRKRLPASSPKDAHLLFAKKMSSKVNGEVDEDFKLFCKSEISKIFGRRWDRRYHSLVANSTLSTSSCLTHNRKKGGVRASGLSRERFLSYCLDNEKIPYTPGVKVLTVSDNGKDRIVTVGNNVRAVLRPLHHLIYDHISKQPWLLRGDAKPKKFSEFTSSPGEVFVSGDYESATDNLSLELYEFLLKEVLNRSELIPYEVKNFACKSARSRFYSKEFTGSYDQTRGQLMGNLLSFPFLCLTNYLAFRYAIRRDVPVLINGDDIVFRATADEASNWMTMVGKCGLTLSVGKTLVDNRLFSLNSTFFHASRRSVKYVPFIRSKAFFSGPDSYDALRGQYGAFCPGFGGKCLSLLRSAFLSHWSSMIWKSNRSITRDLRMSASWITLSRVGFAMREVFYLQLPKPPALPIPPSIVRYDTVPPGWSRKDLRGFPPHVIKEMIGKEKATFRELQFSLAWSTNFTSFGDEKQEWARYWDRCRKTTFRYVHLKLTMLSRLLKIARWRVVDMIMSKKPKFVKVKVPLYVWVKKITEEPSFVPEVVVELPGKRHCDVSVMGSARFPYFTKTWSTETWKQWAKPVSLDGQIVYADILRQMSNGYNP